MSAAELSAARNMAADWLARRDAGLTAADQARLDQWIAASPVNRQAWSEAIAAWAQFGDMDDDLLEVMRTQALAARPVANDNWRRGLLAASGMAAALLVGVLAWGVLGPALQPAHVESFATGYGQRAERRLADGTDVILDSQTILQTEFDRSGRRVRLIQGQAYFNVAAEGRPFSVQAGDRTVTDIGTRFAIRGDKPGDGGVTVILEQGLVSVSGAGEQRRLQPGDRYRARPGVPGVVDRVDPIQALAWRNGYLEFRNTALRDAIGEFNRYGGRQIILRDQEAGDLRISGRFPADDPTGFAQAVAVLQPVDAVQTRDGITLRVRR
jgi:transmembrane sensor